MQSNVQSTELKNDISNQNNNTKSITTASQFCSNCKKKCTVNMSGLCGQCAIRTCSVCGASFKINFLSIGQKKCAKHRKAKE